MPRRVSLPGAAELFRTTHTPEERPTPEPQRIPGPDGRADGADHSPDARTPDARTGAGHGDVDGERTSVAPSGPVATPTEPAPTEPASTGPAPADESSAAEPPVKKAPTRRRAAVQGSGRVRHDEKITVYVSQDELLALEHARLSLRAEHGMAVDRGRIVREAIAAAIAGLAEDGADSELIRRLSQP